MVTQSVAFERLSRVVADVPLPPGWKWAMVVGEPAVEGPGREYRDEHSWLTWYGNKGAWNVRIVPPGYKNEPFSSGQIVLIETDLDDVVEAAKVLAGYVWLGMVSP